MQEKTNKSPFGQAEGQEAYVSPRLTKHQNLKLVTRLGEPDVHSYTYSDSEDNNGVPGFGG
jgi:hypothetical protein